MNFVAIEKTEQQLRIDLAALFRIVARLGLHEAVANHFSAAVSPDGKRFLLNPKWRHFSRIKASDLLLLDADDSDARSRTNIDPTAWAIHGQIHQRLPHARSRCICIRPSRRRSPRSKIPPFRPSTRTPRVISTASPSTLCIGEWPRPNPRARDWRPAWATRGGS